MTFEFLSPRQGPTRGLVEPASRPGNLRGKRLGLLWNNQVGGDYTLNRIGQLLDDRHGLADIFFIKKPFLGNGAPDDILDAIVAAGVEMAVTGVGD